MAAGTRVSGMKRHFIIAEATPILCQAGQGRGEERRVGGSDKLCASGAELEVKGCVRGYFVCACIGILWYTLVPDLNYRQ